MKKKQIEWRNWQKKTTSNMEKRKLVEIVNEELKLKGKKIKLINK